MKLSPPKRVSTLLLKAALVVIGIAVIGFSVLLFPEMWPGMGGRPLPSFVTIVYIAVIGIYATLVPFLYALMQAFKLLQHIDANNAFSEASILALERIKYAAISMTALYALALPLAYMIAELDDAPGLILFSTAFAGAPLIVATFAAVLQKVFRSALDMKQEHDLTV